MFFCTASLRAQAPLSNLVFSVGTTIADGLGQQWSYLLLDSADPAVLAGRRFAVFGKPGNAGSANPFTQRGTVARQTDPAVINTLLNRSVALGDDLNSLNNAFATVLRTNILGLLSKVPGILSQPLPQRVATAMQIAAADPEMAEALAMLSAAHPGMKLCLGRAFAEQINSVTTYELRELDPVTGAPGDVVGRVTVTPGLPVVLPAPGRSFQPTTNHPSDHLRIRLRWGTPPDLRRVALLQSGFNVWRIPRAAAETAGFHLTTPTLAQLRGHPAVAAANPGPVIPPVEMDMGSAFGGAQNANDRLTYFFSDNGRAAGITFTNGQEFYYFVTARDILGRDGLVSPGGLARACRRLPPAPPTNLKVENTVVPGSTNQPRLIVTWNQNLNPTNPATHYWVYRWINPTAALTNDAAPLSNRVGVVAQLAGTNVNSFLDDTTGALIAPNLTNVWYTLRAVNMDACDPLLSPHTAPAWGVLRQRDGPVATTGELVGSCGIPVVMFQRFLTNTIAADPQTVRLRLTCVRRDPGIAWVQFSVTNTMTFEQQTLGPVYFPPDGDTAQLDYEPAALITSQARQISVGCVVGTSDDRVSVGATCVINTPFPATQQRQAVFYAGQLLATALSGSDPLLTVYNGGFTQCIGPYSVTPDASGMVAMLFDFNGAPAALIQSLSNNTWLDIAVVTPDSNRVYWVSYPACLIGPLPQFRGCRLNFPASGADCDQHVAVGPVGGAIAPIRVRFKLTPRTREYRVYRRVDEGPMTLFAQGAALYDPAKPTKLIESRDDAMPPSSARLCYFVQVLDEHGNGSPLAFVGCRSVKPPKLPRPILGEPQPAGAAGNPQVVLNWFCPTAGVSRFQFKIAVADAPATTTPSGVTSPQLTVFPAYNKSAGFLGLMKNKLQIVSFSEAHFTPPLSTGFGPGSQFTVTANVLANLAYDICVTPVDEQGVVQQGSTSEVWRFKWTPAAAPVTVPWPARSLPPVREFEPNLGAEFEPRVMAMLFTNWDGTLLDRRYPVGVRIGRLDNSLFFRAPNTYFESNVGTNTFIRYSGLSTIVNPNPHHALFRSLATNATLAGRSILPLVLYRQQVTNALFPRVSGDVTQVSPLIERIPWQITPANQDVTIPDRLFAMNNETYYDASYRYLYVRDQQPVVLGARYRYFVMRFNAQHEPEEIIPAGEVALPLN